MGEEKYLSISIWKISKERLIKDVLEVFVNRDMNIPTIFQGLKDSQCRCCTNHDWYSEANGTCRRRIKEINALDNIISVELQSIE